jgi:hypothetical protein
VPLSVEIDSDKSIPPFWRKATTQSFYIFEGGTASMKEGLRFLSGFFFCCHKQISKAPLGDVRYEDKFISVVLSLL